jgi:Flp pilus assembly protein TadG
VTGRRRRGVGDRGQIMPMATILVIFLMLGFWALVSASQAWTARRDAAAVASAAARAAAQGDPTLLRAGAGDVDPAEALARAQSVIAAAGYTGTVDVNGATVHVTVRARVDYVLRVPGMPRTVGGSSTAVAHRGISGDEGG